jgi:hypothetical protein
MGEKSPVLGDMAQRDRTVTLRWSRRRIDFVEDNERNPRSSGNGTGFANPNDERSDL